ncbi:hypothetical protein Cri9333_2058 [Crinalium epipsammum PCC 9333]|uniref:Pentapeptide repeat protein n=1 Tax=Crinalium epipsammum PCC 9333 TaxID=1173022 RepID=K9VY84_9CYAN|nr:hypothetical protein Cri9333_2058 [Crinalium epipsammum PCC 9333]
MIKFTELTFLKNANLRGANLRNANLSSAILEWGRGGREAEKVKRFLYEYFHTNSERTDFFCYYIYNGDIVYLIYQKVVLPYQNHCITSNIAKSIPLIKIFTF